MSWCEDIDIRATEVRFDDARMWIELEDGRTVAVPLTWFPRLLNGTAEQRCQVQISQSGLHWEDLDEDISVAGFSLESVMALGPAGMEEDELIEEEV